MRMAERFAIGRKDGIVDSMFRRHHHDAVAAGLRQLDLPSSAAHLLSRRGTPVTIPSGTRLCTEGERGLQAFLLLEGGAQVLLPDRVVTLGPGDVVGELATLDPHRTRNATVVADGDVEALVYDVRTFKVLADDPTLRSRLVPERAAA